MKEIEEKIIDIEDKIEEMQEEQAELKEQHQEVIEQASEVISGTKGPIDLYKEMIARLDQTRKLLQRIIIVLSILIFVLVGVIAYNHHEFKIYRENSITAEQIRDLID